MQKSMFPMPYLRITQDEYGKTSHAGSMAMDQGGKNTSSDTPLYAPFDGTLLRVRSNSSHETYFCSDVAVQCPNGYQGIVTLTFMHDNVCDHVAGASCKQGEKIGDEGGFGRGKKDYFSHHSHIEVSKGSMNYQTINSKGTWQTPYQMHIYDAFFLAPDTMVCTGGLTYKRADQLMDATGHLTYMGHVWTVATRDEKPRPAPTSKLQKITIGPVSDGDAAAIYKLCESLDLLGLYKSEYV